MTEIERIVLQRHKARQRADEAWDALQKFERENVEYQHLSERWLKLTKRTHELDKTLQETMETEELYQKAISEPLDDLSNETEAQTAQPVAATL